MELDLDNNPLICGYYHNATSIRAEFKYSDAPRTTKSLHVVFEFR